MSGGIESTAYMKCPECGEKTCRLVNGERCGKCEKAHEVIMSTWIITDMLMNLKEKQ